MEAFSSIRPEANAEFVDLEWGRSIHYSGCQSGIRPIAYTVYGQVISGMEHVDAITRGEPPANPDRMISVKVAADA